MPTTTTNHNHNSIMTTHKHLIISEQEQNAIVNALAFFHALFGSGDDIDPETIEAWQDVADDSDLSMIDSLATKIATLP